MATAIAPPPAPVVPEDSPTPESAELIVDIERHFRERFGDSRVPLPDVWFVLNDLRECVAARLWPEIIAWGFDPAAVRKAHRAGVLDVQHWESVALEAEAQRAHPTHPNARKVAATKAFRELPEDRQTLMRLRSAAQRDRQQRDRPRGPDVTDSRESRSVITHPPAPSATKRSRRGAQPATDHAITRRRTESLAGTLTKRQARTLTDVVKADAHALWLKLLRLHDGGAHTALGYSSWATYCAAEFEMSDASAYRLVQAARVVAQLPMGSSSPNQRQARELVPLLDDPPALEATWRDVTDRAAEAKQAVTAVQVRDAVERRLLPRPSAEESSQVMHRRGSAGEPVLERAAELLDGVSVDFALEDLQRLLGVDRQRAMRILAELTVGAESPLIADGTRYVRRPHLSLSPESADSPESAPIADEWSADRRRTEARRDAVAGLLTLIRRSVDAMTFGVGAAPVVALIDRELAVLVYDAMRSLIKRQTGGAEIDALTRHGGESAARAFTDAGAYFAFDHPTPARIEALIAMGAPALARIHVEAVLTSEVRERLASHRTGLDLPLTRAYFAGRPALAKELADLLARAASVGGTGDEPNIAPESADELVRVCPECGEPFGAVWSVAMIESAVEANEPLCSITSCRWPAVADRGDDDDELDPDDVVIEAGTEEVEIEPDVVLEYDVEAGADELVPEPDAVQKSSARRRRRR